MTPTQFLETINSINELLLSAHSLRHSFVDNALAFFSLQLSKLFTRTHYEKVRSADTDISGVQLLTYFWSFLRLRTIFFSGNGKIAQIDRRSQCATLQPRGTQHPVATQGRVHVCACLCPFLPPFLPPIASDAFVYSYTCSSRSSTM